MTLRVKRAKRKMSFVIITLLTVLSLIRGSFLICQLTAIKYNNQTITIPSENILYLEKAGEYIVYFHNDSMSSPDSISERLNVHIKEVRKGSKIPVHTLLKRQRIVSVNREGDILYSFTIDKSGYFQVACQLKDDYILEEFTLNICQTIDTYMIFEFVAYTGIIFFSITFYALMFVCRGTKFMVRLTK